MDDLTKDSLWFALKTSNREGQETLFWCSRVWPATLIKIISQLWAKRRTSTPWLVEFQNGSEKTNQKAERGWISFPSLITGPASENWRVKSGTVRWIKPQWTEEMTMWRVSWTAAAGSQRPVSWHGCFFFYNLLHWLRLRSHQARNFYSIFFFLSP